jgi:hypothetical protein
MTPRIDIETIEKSSMAKEIDKSTGFDVSHFRYFGIFIPFSMRNTSIYRLYDIMI